MNHWSQECRQWGIVWSIWWDSSFCHIDDQDKNTISQWNSLLMQQSPWKSQEFQKLRPQRKVAQWLCKICSTCENMVSCVKMWLVLNICLKYAKCVKIWPFVLEFDFHWIFMSMFENMVICLEILLSLHICVKYAHVWKYGCFWSVCCFLESCVQFLVKQKGDAPTEHVSHILVRGDTHCGGASPFYSICTQKRKPAEYFPRECSLHQHTTWPLAHIRACMCANGHSAGPVQEAPREAHAVWNLQST
jgi:hypothetical protein